MMGFEPMTCIHGFIQFILKKCYIMIIYRSKFYLLICLILLHLSSYIATGVENVPIFIRAENSENKIESFIEKQK